MKVKAPLPNSRLAHPPFRLPRTRFLLKHDLMRLRADEAQAIREEIRRAEPSAEIYLFGSRADDKARGGDIGLLVVSESLRFRDLLQLRSRILDRIGWQQLDLQVRRRDELHQPLAAAALETGVKL